ncbi:MAG: DUF503 domain-containing protein [Planctomycetota bacterium]
MFVGVLQVSLSLETPRSLKEKRRIVKSIVGRVRARFNVSAAEVDDLDEYTRAGLGFAAVSNDSRHAEGLLQQVLNHLLRHPAARVADHRLEVL